VCCRYGVFKVRVDRLSSGLSKLNSDPRRGRRTSRRPGIPDGKETSINGPGASGVMAPDSLERR